MSDKVIIVGAGLGGLSAAISMASEGYDVEIFEKNEHVGGKLDYLVKNGYFFDLGPSILTMPFIFEKLFSICGKKMEDYVKIEDLKLHWRGFYEDGTKIDLYPDEKNLKEKNIYLNSKDIKDLFKFLNYSKKLYEISKTGYFCKGLDTMDEIIKFYGWWSCLKDFDVFSNVAKGVSRYISNPHLKNLMNYFIKYVGSSPYDAPAILNLIPYVQFHYGLWYVKGGMYNLAIALEKLLEEVGVKIYFNSEIVELLKYGNIIKGVRLKDGAVRQGSIFISNMEVIPAYQKLLNEKKEFISEYVKFEPACSGLVMHLAVKKEYEQLAHHNFFFSTNSKQYFNTVFHDKTLPLDPTIYLVAPKKTDKSLSPDGTEILKILPHIPYIQNKPCSRYDYIELRYRVFRKLERMGLKDLEKNIIFEEIRTPEDIQKRYYSNRGSIYGVVSNRRKNYGLKAPKSSTKYSNLYFVGGSVNPGCGMPMVTLSGLMVKDKILSKSSHVIR
jgi:diapolycopene oxygenase